MALLDRVEKMEWMQACHANMQNFSLTVALPALKPIAGPADVIVRGLLLQRLSGLSSVYTPSHSRKLAQAPEQTATCHSVLERFRSTATNDLTGSTSRHTIVTTVSRANPDLQGYYPATRAAETDQSADRYTAHCHPNR
ncbi:hypothetical protein PHMEG_00027412 [Phytophthora megakarya]|uniref:Uncharacterized protein n=1 Tax=Phytophthora megakarya TaxID=4795 RepID=A0A225V7A5_9STRA|nr:hypothetical protein PHMEG_00027412 [Phytophthora megakarya]